MFIIRGFFILSCIAVVVKSQDGWCDPKLCTPNPLPHVGCFDGGDPSWDPRCKNPEQIAFTPEMQKLTLDEHNRLRNQQAMGKTPGYEPAKRMATMTWDDELAGLAGYNTLQCKMEHDRCRSTWNFQYAGQNLAINNDMDNNKLAKWAPGFWFDEYPLANMDDINKQSRLEIANGSDIGHFTQVVRDISYKVGCGMSKFTDDGGNRRALIACNYAVANTKNFPIYEKGPTASGCKSGTNPKYPGLCSEKEEYHGLLLDRQ